MKDKYQCIKKVHFSEIPSIKFIDDSTITFKDGLHVYLTNCKNQQHRLYIPETFHLNIQKLLCSKHDYQSYDVTAMYVYQYIKSCSFTKSQKKILWKLLRYSNSLWIAIKKFLEILELT